MRTAAAMRANPMASSLTSIRIPKALPFGMTVPSRELFVPTDGALGLLP